MFFILNHLMIYLPNYKTIPYMSKAGTPTDNEVVKSRDNQIKSELFTDLYIKNKESVK